MHVDIGSPTVVWPDTAREIAIEKRDGTRLLPLAIRKEAALANPRSLRELATAVKARLRVARGGR